MPRLIIVALFAFFAAISYSRAEIIPSFVGVTETASGDTLWSYRIDISGALFPGDFFTIYDFGNTVSIFNNIYIGYWPASSSLIGVTPSGTIPADNPTIPNVTFTYIGPIAGGFQTGFSIITPGFFPQINPHGEFASETNNLFVGEHSRIASVGFVPVPASPIPEPSTIELVVMAACFASMGCGFAKCRKAA